jgi:ATP-dependent DNA helicase RecG
VPSGDPPLTLADLREIPLERLKGVGPALEARLADMELLNVLDLLQHYPRRWIDRSKKTDIAALAVGEAATIFAEVRTIHGRRGRGGKSVVDAVVHDGSSMLAITFFNQAWREKQ